MPEGPRIAYLTSFYPHAADTFIRREITALRALGFDVRPFSVRDPGAALSVSDDICQERARTEYLLKGKGQLLRSLLLFAGSRPHRMASAIRIAWGSGGRGIKARVWQMAYVAEAARLARRLQALGVEHLHNHIGENSATVAMLASAMTGIPFSMTVHGPGDFDHPVAIGLGMKLERAAFVIAVTEFGRSQMFRWCGHEHWTKIHVIRCGLDQSFLGLGATPVPGAPRLVCVGRICEAKGQLLLADAAADLLAEGTALELVFVGDGPMRAALEQLIARRGIASSVKLAGWMSSLEVREQLLLSRGLVLPSFAEGLPVVIMEALALGRPVISTYVAGIPELVRPGVNGWLVPAGSIEALKGALRQMLTASPQRLTEMGRAGAEAVRRQHDIAAEAAKLAELFRAISGRQEKGNAVHAVNPATCSS